MDDRKTSPARARISRVALVICIGLLCTCGTHILIELVGRLSNLSAFLFRTEVDVSLSIVAGIGLAALGAYRLPGRVWEGWLAMALLALPLLACTALVAPMWLHVKLGTPRLDCGREGLEVDTCVGRDWSFMQGRFAYRRATGSIDEAVCRGFVAGISEEAASPVNAEGWVRCPYDNPSVWAARSCTEVGLSERSQCYVCSGMSSTNDRFTHVQAFNSDCTQATITYGVAVPPAAIDRCEQSIDRASCSAAIWGER